MNQKVLNAYSIALEIEEMVKTLETLVNGKQGFLKELKKSSADIGICRLNEDVFMAKTLTKRIADILHAVRDTIEDSVANEDDLEDEPPDIQYNKEAYNKSKSIY